MDEHEKIKAQQREGSDNHFGLSIKVSAAMCIAIALHLTSRYNYILFHNLSEGFSICISVGVFMLAWNSRRFMDNHYLLFLGITSLFIGFLDGIHTLAYKGMGVFDGYGANLATQLWILARYVQSLSLLAAPFFIKRTAGAPRVFLFYAVVTALALMSIFYWQVFPLCYVEGEGLTAFKIISEYVICLIFLASLGAVILQRQSFDPGVLRLIIGVIVFSIAAELAFTQYFGVYDLFNQIGHYFKIIAYYLLYRAVIVTGLRNPYDLLFRNLRQSEETLAKTNMELSSHRDHLKELVDERTLELEERNKKLGEEIAERVKAEDALQKSVTEIKDLYNNAPCGYHSLDSDGIYLRINDTELKWLGYTREEVIGKVRFSDILTPASVQLFMKSFPRFKEKGRLNDIEYEMIRKDGTILPVLLNATAIRDRNGNFVMSRSTLFDITLRKKMDEELQRAARDWQNTFDSIKDQVMILDKDLRIDRVNAEAARFLQRPSDEITGNHCYNLMHHSHQPAGKCPLRKMLQSKHNEESEVYDEARDKWLLITVDPMFDDKGDIIRIVHTVKDITDRKRAEEDKKKLEVQLVQAQKMEALGRFAGGIAHDLNNILYPILINTEMLLKEASVDAPSHQTLKQTLQAIYRQRDLIKQILSFSRRSEQKLDPIRITPLIEETLVLLRSSIPSTIEIRRRIDAPEDTILGDPTQILQVIMNLCRNAVDALPLQQGAIEVGLTKALLDPRPIHPDVEAGEYLLLTVKDTGEGMAPEVMSRIYEPFYTTKEVGKGSGMGLAVVHGIIKDHGGIITAESESGKGSLFSVYLPLTREKAAMDEKDIDKSLASKEKKRILLIDDEDIILTSVQRVLKVLGYDVTIMKDSREALELFTEDPWETDLVITDLTMPKLNGIELASGLMKVRTDIPIILCTGFNDAVDEKKAKALGIRDLLMKPADMGELKAAIDRALEK